MSYRILLRRDLSQNWNYNDPVLMSGEPGYEMDTRKFKMGDGQTPWSQLPYYCGITGPAGADSTTPGATGPTGATGGYLEPIFIDNYSGTRLKPIGASYNGFYLEVNRNEATGIKLINTNSGNGAYSGISVSGATGYNKGLGIQYFSPGYYIPYLQGKNGLVAFDDLFFVGASGCNFDFRTGQTYGSETSKFKINYNGQLNIGVAPSTDNTITSLLGRKSDGSIVTVESAFKVYMFRLDRSSGTPVSSIDLQNTIGSIVLSNGPSETVTATLTGAFPATNKVVIFSNGVPAPPQFTATADAINFSGSTGNFIEIRVYN